MGTIKLVVEIDEETLNRIRAAKSVPDMFGTDIVNGLNALREGSLYKDNYHSGWNAGYEAALDDEGWGGFRHFK